MGIGKAQITTKTDVQFDNANLSLSLLINTKKLCQNTTLMTQPM